MNYQFLKAWKDEALGHGDEDMARIINAAMWYGDEGAIEALEAYQDGLEGNEGPAPDFPSFDVTGIAQYADECLHCGTEPDKRTCEGCGLTLTILDCEHDHAQPKDIDYCAVRHEMLCEDCYDGEDQ